MQAQLQNQAGAALVRHIKWWQHCFFRCLNLASQKDGTFDILSRCEANMFIVLVPPPKKKIKFTENSPSNFQKTL